MRFFEGEVGRDGMFLAEMLALKETESDKDRGGWSLRRSEGESERNDRDGTKGCSGPVNPEWRVEK